MSQFFGADNLKQEAENRLFPAIPQDLRSLGIISRLDGLSKIIHTFLCLVGFSLGSV